VKAQLALAPENGSQEESDFPIEKADKFWLEELSPQRVARIVVKPSRFLLASPAGLRR
jgi:hypothetical protein